jgi:hypothetical protein
VAEAASGQPIDGFELTRTLSCAALGIIPVAGDGLAVACDTLSARDQARALVVVAAADADTGIRALRTAAVVRPAGRTR